MSKRRARRAWASAAVIAGFKEAVGGFAMAEIALDVCLRCEVAFWVCGLVLLDIERVADVCSGTKPSDAHSLRLYEKARVEARAIAVTLEMQSIASHHSLRASLEQRTEQHSKRSIHIHINTGRVYDTVSVLVTAVRSLAGTYLLLELLLPWEMDPWKVRVIFRIKISSHLRCTREHNQRDLKLDVIDHQVITGSGW